MFCHKCGQALPTDAEFCIKCGSGLAQVNATTVNSGDTKTSLSAYVKSIPPAKKPRRIIIKALCGIAAAFVVLVVVSVIFFGDNEPATPAATPSAQHQQPMAQQQIAPTQPLTLEDHVVGEWVVVMAASLEEYQLGDSYTFFVDGTGLLEMVIPSEWYDNPREFTWWIAEAFGGDALGVDFLDGGGGFFNALSVGDNEMSVGSMRFERADFHLPQHTQQAPRTEIDSALVGGRWLADNGRSLEFLQNGTGQTNYDLFWWNAWGVRDTEITWSASNGRLEITGHHRETNRHRTEEDVALSWWIAYGDTMVIEGNDYMFYREPSIGSGIVGGQWFNPVTNVSIEYFADGTGRRRWNHNVRGVGDLPWTYFRWETQNDLLIKHFAENISFDYIVEGSQLSVFMDSGRVVHTRVGG